MEEVARADLGGCGRLVLLMDSQDALKGLHPGQDVMGQVTLTLHSRPFLMRGLWCKLSGMSVVMHQEKEVACVDLLQGEEDFQDGGVVEVLAGFGEADHNDQGELLELSEASYTWPWSFKIPLGAPYSHADRHCEVLYSLTCTLDSPAVCRADAQLHHSLVVGCIGPDTIPPYEVPPATLDVLPAEYTLLHGPLLAEYATPSPWGTLARLLRRLVGASASPVAPRAAYKLALTSDRLAVFPFRKTKLTLPISAALSAPSALHKRLCGATVRLTARVLLQTCLRRDAFTAFSGQDELSAAEADKSKGLWAKRRAAAVMEVLWEGTRDAITEPAPPGGSDEREMQLHARYDVPLRIDPTHRQACLSSWPRPSPITHDAAADEAHAACLYGLSCDSPLARLTYWVEVEAWYEPKAPLGSRPRKPVELCRHRAEIFVHPLHHGPPPGQSGEAGDRGGRMGASSSSHHGPTSPRMDRPPRPVPPTPHASLAPVRVVGELLSRGPAALLMDRGSSAPNQQFVTPQRFAHLHRVVAGGVELVPGTPAFTPAIAFLLSPEARPGSAEGHYGGAGEVEAEASGAAAEPLLPAVVLGPLSRVLGENDAPGREESKEEPVVSPSAQALRLVSPVPSGAMAAAAAFASTPPGQLRPEEDRAQPQVGADASPALQALLAALPTQGPLLSRLQSQTAYHTLPLHSLCASDVQALLLLCLSSADREGVLFLVLQEGCLEPGADVDILAPGGCIDTCFSVNVQKGECRGQYIAGHQLCSFISSSSALSPF